MDQARPCTDQLDGTDHRRTALVIGAGIGGLTAALALAAEGWRVEVHERADALEPVGSGLGVAPNALRALDRLGLGDQVRGMAVAQGDVCLRRPSGRRLARTSAESLTRAFGDSPAVVLRPELIALLARRLPQGALHTGSELRLLDPGTAHRPAELVGRHGRRRADLVVAADGIHSAARAVLFPDHRGPRYGGFAAWRTVVDAPMASAPVAPASVPPGPVASVVVGPAPVAFGSGVHAPGEPLAIGETWGRGALTGVLPLPGNRLYLYAAALAPAGQRAADGDERAELLRRFGGWCAPLPALLASCDSGQVLRNDIYEMATPLPAYHRGRTVLIGDAAHAMTPFQGQGACQAVEDAVVLAHALRAVTDPSQLEAALAGYSAARVPRTTRVVRSSARVARAVAVRSRAGVALRDLGLALAGRLPQQAVLRAAAPVFDWQPPGVTMLPPG